MPYVVVAYDIPDNTRRLRLARALWGMLDRVQKSVFEGELEQELQEQLEARIRRIVVEAEDAVRIYTLCALCQRRIRGIGQGVIPEPPSGWII